MAYFLIGWRRPIFHSRLSSALYLDGQYAKSVVSWWSTGVLTPASVPEEVNVNRASPASVCTLAWNLLMALTATISNQRSIQQFHSRGLVR